MTAWCQDGRTRVVPGSSRSANAGDDASDQAVVLGLGRGHAAPTPRDLVTVGKVELGVAAFAAPSYAKTLKPGYGVADVDWIAWAPPFDDKSPNPELARLIPDFRPAFASDDFILQMRAAELGLGALFLGRMEHRFSGSPKLVELDLDPGSIRHGLYLVCARTALDIPRVRAVAELLGAELERAESLSRHAS